MKCVCKLRDQNKWLSGKRKFRATIYSSVRLNYCRLCLTEKFHLINLVGNEIVSKKLPKLINEDGHQIVV